ncbi:MAG: efflux RND transporter permease subunit, partial [Deltaproteobacteria bacterium]|nr:efflux RND transporter permease subunit [Deltaproteobacteria bacterium]
MSLIEFCLRKPVLLTVGVVFALLAGIWSLLSLPIQLTPDIEMPRVTVRTQWPGASPYEIEREILRPQEEQLNNLPRLISMNSTARSGFGSVTLEFDIGTDINQLLPRISNQLSGVTRYPENASQPAIVLTGENSSPVVWAQLIALEGNARSIRTYKAFVEDQVIPELEKVAGVSEVRVYGGQDPELQVRFDSDRLALHGITLNELIRRLRAEHTDVSGGAINQGKRVYTVRTVSPFRTPETLGLLVLKNTDSGTVLLRDVAEVRLGHKTGGSFNIS